MALQEMDSIISLSISYTLTSILHSSVADLLLFIASNNEP